MWQHMLRGKLNVYAVYCWKNNSKERSETNAPLLTDHAVERGREHDRVYIRCKASGHGDQI